jgi:hypothetical protein
MNGGMPRGRDLGSAWSIYRYRVSRYGIHNTMGGEWWLS